MLLRDIESTRKSIKIFMNDIRDVVGRIQQRPSNTLRLKLAIFSYFSVLDDLAIGWHNSINSVICIAGLTKRFIVYLVNHWIGLVDRVMVSTMIVVSCPLTGGDDNAV